MAEKEYIERDSLAGKLIEMKYCSTSSKIDFGDVLRLINSEPTADVQEVRHGKWLYEDSDIGWTDYKCSDCGNIISTVAQDEDLYSYCPYCGAKMDRGEQNAL